MRNVDVTDNNRYINKQSRRGQDMSQTANIETAETMIVDTTVTRFLEIMEQEIKVVAGYKQDAFRDMINSDPQIAEKATKRYFEYCNRLDGLFFARHAFWAAHAPSKINDDILGCYASGGNYNSNGAKPYKRSD